MHGFGGEDVRKMDPKVVETLIAIPRFENSKKANLSEENRDKPSEDNWD